MHRKQALPSLALDLVTRLTKECESDGRQVVHFTVDKIPKSLNHQYIHTRFNTRLDDSVHEFRVLVKNAMVGQNIIWRPVASASAIVIFYSPKWVTAESKIRKMDADNKVKPVFDAIERATGSPDEAFWSFHVFKAPCKKEFIRVFLFDMGDVIDYYC